MACFELSTRVRGVPDSSVGYHLALCWRPRGYKWVNTGLTLTLEPCAVSLAQSAVCQWDVSAHTLYTQVLCAKM